MSLSWIAESPARWDADKERIIGGAPSGVFALSGTEGSLVPGDWWRVEHNGAVIGYGWMDVTWGYAPVLVAVDPAAQDKGTGRFVMDKLAAEAKERGLHYIFNVIPASHPDTIGLKQFLEKCGFQSSEADPRMLRRRV